MYSKSSSWGCYVAALAMLAAGPLLAAPRLPSFPDKPADANEARWLALQTAVTANIPTSTKLTAVDGAQSDEFGYSVALSGTTALVSAVGKAAVYVFTFNGSTWVQKQELSASDGAAGFGSSVALSGATAMVGASDKTIGTSAQQGAVYVFKFNGTTWVQQQELTASDGAAYGYFGDSIALSDTTALVGAVGKAAGVNTYPGATYIYAFNGSTWVQQQKLTASDGAAGDNFGGSVALSGTSALVGASGKPVGSNSAQGAAYSFTFNGSTWVQQQELTANDGVASDYFGASIGLSGTTALVGAPDNWVGSNPRQGAAYVFTFNGSTWVQQQKLTTIDGAAFDLFGTSVALSDATALVGASNKNTTNGPNGGQGAAYVFESSGGHWIQQQELTAFDGASIDYFGTTVALSGTTALVGAWNKSVGSNILQGAAYVFYPVSDTIFHDAFDGTL